MLPQYTTSRVTMATAMQEDILCRCISTSYVVTVEPDSGVQKVSMIRSDIKGVSRTLGAALLAATHNSRIPLRF